MNEKSVCLIMLSLLIASTVTLPFNIQPVKASETIYIRSDGSIDPPAASIHRAGNLYTLTNDIYDSIVVERDNIVIDGAGYTVQGTGSGRGIDLSNRSNIGIKNIEIRAFRSGIVLWYSNFCSISENDVRSNSIYGITCWHSNSNIVSGNIAANSDYGIALVYSNSNIVSENMAANNMFGIYVYTSSYNHIYHNDITNNSIQAYRNPSSCPNAWRTATTPYQGNYWNDFEGKDVDGDGIGDTYLPWPGVDFYPLMEPWSTWPHIPAPDFEISVFPLSQSVGVAESVEYEITITSINGFCSAVSFNASESPEADLNFTFNPLMVIPLPDGAVQSTLTVTTTPSTPLGTITINLTATAQAKKKSLEVCLFVGILQPDFEMSISPDEQSVGREESAEYTINIASINDFQSEVSLYVLASYPDLGIEFYPSKVTPPPSGTIESTLTITTTGSTPLWTFEIEIWAADGGIERNDTIKLSVEISLEVPYQKQGETNWCGPASLAMVLRYYGEEFHSWDYAKETNLPSWGFAWMSSLEEFIRNHYPELETRVGSYSDSQKDTVLSHIKSNLSRGFPIIMMVSSGVFPNHFVVVVGYNETGLFLNDPSGAFFTDIMHPHSSRTSYNHAYIEWNTIKDYTVTWPRPATMAVAGNPDQPEGTTYFTTFLQSNGGYNLKRSGIEFQNPSDDTKYYFLDLDQGLKWKKWLFYSTDPVISPSCNKLKVEVQVSNSKRVIQSSRLSCRILRPDGTINPLEVQEKLVPAFVQYGYVWYLNDIGNVLEKGGPYYIELSLYDSYGFLVDEFITPPFYWIQGTKAKLSESQKHLHLHVYDEEGNHVGLNYATNQAELEIPGSYYRDDGNGTTIIVLPQIIDLTIVVDAAYAEDPVESYNLTVTLTTDLGVFSENCSGNIMAGRNQIFRTQVSETGLELSMIADVDIAPDTLNLKSNGEWIAAYIELPEGYNVEDVDVSTIMLNNTIPVDLDAPAQIGDYDVDGAADLMVKFDRASINEWLGAIDYSEEIARRCSVTLAITGKVSDVAFQGLDAIEVLHK